MKTPLIFDIIRSSTVDGPGLRTAIFFKGCNLRCRWCHNPEGQLAEAQAAFFEDKCVGCGACMRVCASEECVLCGKCVDVCPRGARKIYGKVMTPRQIFTVAERDSVFYAATGGGVTFSGGECMLYPDFLAECAALCKSGGISVAIDTAGCVPYDNFRKVMPYADLFLYDIKCITEKTHIEYTGQSNALIIDNLEKLISDNAEIIVRVPLIEGFNSGAESERIKEFLSRKHLKVEYLSYHEMGEGKRRALEKGKFFKKGIKNA